MKSFEIRLSEYGFAGVMAYQQLYGQHRGVREALEEILGNYIESIPELKDATNIRYKAHQ
jgi:hypothetical protein